MADSNPQFEPAQAAEDHPHLNAPSQPAIVRDLEILIHRNTKFSTVYADPPWPYSNTAARGAAENQYRTMTLEAIPNEPVSQLVADQAHLHLWTTNAFLREAFDVIRAWGFKYKSCLIWTKPQLGMGNYWRVSHEYLLLGVLAGVYNGPCETKALHDAP